MSVIYDVLNKIKKPVDKKQELSISHGNVLIFEDLFKKNALLVSILLVLVISVVVGCLYYLYQFETASSGVISIGPINHNTAEETFSTQSAEEELTKPAAAPVLEEPEEFVVAHIAAGTIPEEPTNFPAKVAVEGDSQKLAADISSQKATVKTVNKIPAVIRSQVEKTAGGQRQEVHPVLTVEQKMAMQSRPAIIPEAKSVSEVVSQPGRSKLSLGSTGDQVLPVFKKISSKMRPSTLTETVSTVAVNSKKPQQKFATRNAKNDFNPTIQNLNRELRQSIERHDFAMGTEILEKLETLLGTDSNYILKLKAYFYLQNNKIDQAQKLLNRVLENNETDLEAGLNMIVVLVQQGELKKAQRQVSYLLNYYPGNQVLLHFKQQIGN